MIEVSQTMRENFAREGVIKVEGLLNEAEVAECRRCFDFNLENPSPTAHVAYEGTRDAHYSDLGSAESLKLYEPMLRKLDFAEFLSQLWGSEHVWYLGEEVFVKDGGKPGRTHWHQDTPYFPADGRHLVNIWMSFEHLPARNVLEVVRRSHLGPMYDGMSYDDIVDPTSPLWGEEYLPRLPDIEAERKEDPSSWDVHSCDLSPGDALVFHSGCLHGGAPVDAECPTRHTLVLRFFGDDLYYRPFPDTKPNYFMDLREFNVGSMKPGDLYRDENFLQLR